MADAAKLRAACAGVFNLRIGQRVHHREHQGRRVTGIVHCLSIDDERGLMVSILLDEPIVIRAPFDLVPTTIHWQTAPADEFQPFDERDEVIADLLKALQDVLRDWHDGSVIEAYRGKPGAVDVATMHIAAARAAVAKATGSAS